MLISLWIAVQIIIEMLPISSSGHLLLLEAWYKRYFSFEVKEYFLKQNIEIKDIYFLLHGPTLVVILLYFWNQWISFVMPGIFLEIHWRPILWVALADGVVALFYLYPLTHPSTGSGCVKPYLPTGTLHILSSALLRAYRRIIPLVPPVLRSLGVGGSDCEQSEQLYRGVVIGFIITALALFSTAWCTGAKLISSWHFTDALLLGCAQSLAFLPGISRLAITCAAGCMLGFSLMDAFCLSWLIQAPLMGAAFLKGMYNIAQSNKLGQILNWRIVLIIIASSGISWYALQFVVSTIKSGVFYYWGWYMILPITTFLFFIIKK